jgi:hypothetical protein
MEENDRMSHPHQSMIDEFQFAIKHFVPTVPQEVRAEAQKVLDELSGNEAIDEAAIKKAFYEVGVKEYPHRKAYEELTHSSAQTLMNQMVLEHVDETVFAVVKPHLDSGVSLDELVSSDLFTQSLDAKQRYQVEDGILVARDKLAELLKAQVGDQAQRYQTLVKKWGEHAQQIQTAINDLETLTQGGEENQKAEIEGKVSRLREGFLITEPDPQLEEVQKEIEYWTDIFAEED